MRVAVFAWVVLIGGPATAIPAVADTATYNNPEQLWRDFNPETPDLETESIKTWQEGGIALEKLRFTAERVEGGRVRVFAIRGAPQQGVRLPGILHIHGGGQTASLEWVRFWAKRGYVCVTFDFTGPWAGRKEFTDWGPVPQGNLVKARGGLLVRPTPRASTWYHWALVSRRALTLLSYHPKVDRERLGVFGVSVGGTLCWLVAGSDERVKTAVPIYGCGYNYSPAKNRIDRDTGLFNRTLAPEAYAESIRKPVLLLDATNDFHGWMDDAYQILSKTHVTNRVAFSPRYNHHIEPAQAADLPAWMDWQLRGGKPFPEEPKLELRLNSDGEPAAVFHTDDVNGVANVEVFYSLGEKASPDRFWRKAQVKRSSDVWKAIVPVLDTTQTLRAFANVTYQSGVCLSTNCPREIPRRLGAKATLRWTAAPEWKGDLPGAPFVMAAANTDPNVLPEYFVRSNDPSAPDAVCLNPKLLHHRSRFDIVSRYIGDPGFAGRPGMALALECQGYFPGDAVSDASKASQQQDPLPAGLTIRLSAETRTPRAATYSAHVPVDAVRIGWFPVRVRLGQFRTAKGESLQSWNRVEQIELLGVTTRDHPARFAHFRWVPE